MEHAESLGLSARETGEVDVAQTLRHLFPTHRVVGDARKLDDSLERVFVVFQRLFRLSFLVSFYITALKLRHIEKLVSEVTDVTPNWVYFGHSGSKPKVFKHRQIVY